MYAFMIFYKTEHAEGLTCVAACCFWEWGVDRRLFDGRLVETHANVLTLALHVMVVRQIWQSLTERKFTALICMWYMSVLW